MNTITGGELLARALANEGVKFVFGLQCPEIDPFLAALDGNGIRFVTVRHEAAAVHMAEGVYKTTGQVAAVLGNPGPGSANLIPGMVTALHEGVPVIAITSQHRAAIVYPSTPATFQGQDQMDLFKPAVKWNGPVFEWTRIPELVRMAVARAALLEPQHTVEVPVQQAALVVGGGPAGATAATALAREGRRVLLLERGFRIKHWVGAEERSTGREGLRGKHWVGAEERSTGGEGGRVARERVRNTLGRSALR